jgi:hypothetical protein
VSVTCPAATSCDATISGTSEQWNGTAWSVVPLPLPSGATRPEALGIRCRTTTSCLAVGDYNLGADLGDQYTLIDQFS